MENLPKTFFVYLLENCTWKGGTEGNHNWKQWSTIKKAAVSVINKLTKQGVKSLVSWQHYRKQLITGETLCHRVCGAAQYTQ